VKLERVYLIFSIPDEWTVESTNIIAQIMIPLLNRAGITFSDDYRDRVLFVGELEASMSYNQLNQFSKQPSHFIYSENRCIQHNLYEDQGIIKFKTICFQVKDDYNMKLYYDSFYSLNVIFINDIDFPIFSLKEISNIAYILKQFIFKNLLRMEHLITTPSSYEYNTSAADDILDDILGGFNVC
jgi:hypothetical protein